MRIKYRCDQDDLIAYNQFYINTSPTIRRNRRILMLIIPLIFIVAGVLLAWTERAYQLFLIYAVFAVISGFWVHRRCTRVNKKHVMKLYSEGKNNPTLYDHEIEITNEGIVSVNPVVESKHKFSGIERIASTDKHVFIFIGAMQAFVLPRDKILEGNLDEFVSALREKVQSAASV